MLDSHGEEEWTKTGEMRLNLLWKDIDMFAKLFFFYECLTATERESEQELGRCVYRDASILLWKDVDDMLAKLFFFSRVLPRRCGVPFLRVTRVRLLF